MVMHVHRHPIASLPNHNLFEVNRNPDLSCHTSVLKATIPPVLEEIIGMVTEAHRSPAIIPSTLTLAL